MFKLYLCLALIIVLSCKDKQDDFNSPAGYDLRKPEKFVMPEALNEISGISFYNGNNDSLYAIQDEEGKLFYLHLGDKKAGSTKFAKHGDYEDLAIMNGWMIVLRSEGTLFAFPLTEIGLGETTRTLELKDLLPNGEFEGLYADEENDMLYVLCKQCKADKSSEATTVFMLHIRPDGGTTQKGNTYIDVKTVEKLSGEKKLKLFPSALAQNPRTQEWYILSSANKMLVIADHSWSVKEVYHLDPAHFRQPEGIAFDRYNNLYISNEGDAVSNGNVLKFVFKKSN
jgi:uncharacterized protein YjiK